MSAYLHALDPSAPLPDSVSPSQPSTYNTDQTASQLTNSILTNAQAIIQRAEAEDRDPEAELQDMVGRIVLRGVVTGANWTQDDIVEMGPSEGFQQRNREHGDDDEHGSTKRPRFDDAGR